MMRKLLLHLCAYLFPEREDAVCVYHHTPEQMAAYYLLQSCDDSQYLSSFQNDIIRALIHETKFHANEHAAALGGALLAQFLSTLPRNTSYHIIPIPLSTHRMRTRGYNQVARYIEKGCKDMPHIHTSAHLLVRTRHTTRQTDLSRTARLANVLNVFSVPPAYREKIAGTHIIVLDDVITTGATLHAARIALLEYAPASITTVALAH